MEKKKYNRLSEVLAEKGLSQTYLANELGTSPQAIQKICSNNGQMSMQRLYKVAKILNVDVCELLVRDK